MNNQYDIIIVGAGIVGSATASELARRGQNILLIDQFQPPHNQGSSHGETRVIREAYFEHPDYVPHIQRAYELWKDLENRNGETLLQLTGGLMIGLESGAVFTGAKQSAEEHQLSHEILTAEKVNSRFPAFKMPTQMSAVFEPRAGMLFAERCHEAFLNEAEHSNVTFMWDSKITQWHSTENGVSVEIGGVRFHADQLVLSCGAWMGDQVPELAKKLTVERQVLHWFDPGECRAIFSPERFPIHVWEYDTGKYFYVLPDAGTGVKTAVHHQGETTDADKMNREVSAAEKSEMLALVNRFLPGLNNAPITGTTCLYTNTNDEHFILDWHPDHSNVMLLSPCSGHGFKFAPVIGEIAADLLIDGNTRSDISLFRIDRL